MWYYNNSCSLYHDCLRQKWISILLLYFFRLQVQVLTLSRWKGLPESFADPLVLLQLYLLAHHWILPCKQVWIKSCKVIAISGAWCEHVSAWLCMIVKLNLYSTYTACSALNGGPPSWSWLLCVCSESLIHHPGWSCSSILLDSATWVKFKLCIQL